MSDLHSIEEKLLDYPFTEMFQPERTIFDPHPPCITGKHVGYAHDHGGILSESAFDSSPCGVTGCNLKYREHKHILLIRVKFNGEVKDVPGLQEYLMSINERAEKDGYVGYAFRQVKI